MGIRNAKHEELERLEAKTLDAQFCTVVREGLNCSPFEAEAVVEAVKEVYAPYLSGEGGSSPPGKITLVAVCADEPAGKPVAHCEKRTVCLTIHRGIEDDRCLQVKETAFTLDCSRSLVREYLVIDAELEGKDSKEIGDAKSMSPS